jgi:lipopolysaccharide assembly outer membrane protein LptD (OstA)
MSLRADDVTYNQKTGELEATGNVRAKLETQN